MVIRIFLTIIKYKVKEKTNIDISKNKGLAAVIWRNLILPFIITLVAMLVLTIAFQIIPKNSITTDFLAGWISCVVWFAARKHYAI